MEILTRINDELDFLPLVRITDHTGSLIAEQTLRTYGRDEFICQFGAVSIGKTSLRITPRKCREAAYYDVAPIKITW